MTRFTRMLLLSAPIAWAAFFAWATAIFVLSTIPGGDGPDFPQIPGFDKILHFVAFAAGGGALAFALRNTWPHWTWTRICRVAFVALLIYGAVDEYRQLSTPDRSGGDVGDWIADALGALAGVLLAKPFHERLR